MCSNIKGDYKMFDCFKRMSRVFLALTVLTMFSAIVILLCHGEMGIDLRNNALLTVCFICLLFSGPGIFAGLTVLTRALAKELFAYDVKLQERLLPSKKSGS